MSGKLYNNNQRLMCQRDKYLKSKDWEHFNEALVKTTPGKVYSVLLKLIE